MNKPVHKQVCDLIESYKEINFFYNETDRWQMILLIAQKFSGIFHDIHYFLDYTIFFQHSLKQQQNCFDFHPTVALVELCQK